MSENLQKFLILLGIAVGMFYVLSGGRDSESESRETVRLSPRTDLALPDTSENAPTPPAQDVKRAELKVAVPPLPKLAPAQKGSRPANSLRYRLDDGIVVVQGDMALGELVQDAGDPAAATGFVAAPKIQLWKSAVIPFYIQPDVQNPERVLRALEMFTGTSIQFVPFTDEEDVMVFEDGRGVCKSYVGWVGGKQPLWIPPNCGADDIAHEILHALGFVHEQNRADRDQYIVLRPENIDEHYQENFFLLPQDLMLVSGLAVFDYESLMLYPPDMFSKNGQPTMESRHPDKIIAPTRGLSAGDRERLEKAYSR